MERLTVIERQRGILRDAISRHVAKGDAYALVDFPDYSNVGDTAIWLGASRLLKEITGRPPKFICTYANYKMKELAAFCPSGPIFITGGGNFGDIYPWHQDLRKALLADFPGRPIIQLPQSIHFNEQANVASTAEAIAQHGAFTLMVRDDDAKAFAEKHFDCQVVVAPDCAFGLGPVEPPHRPQTYFQMLLRADDERSGADYSALGNTRCAVDWGRPRFPESRRKAIRLFSKFNPFNGLAERMNLCAARADWRFRHGISLLSEGEVVITDRLHGHILSILLGIPDVALDNSTGKVSAYHRRWMSDLESSFVAKSAEEAVQLIPRLKF